MQKVPLPPPILLILLLASLSACVPAPSTVPNTITPPASTPAPSAAPPSATATLSPTVPAQTLTSPPATFTDPFAYCAAVSTIDTPDSRFSGPHMPDVLAKGLRKASGASADAPDELFTTAAFWRCMDGKVYACTVGANLPCESKANTDQVPTQAETDFCQANPASDFIPAAVTGHDTIYAWRCTQGKPVVDKQVFQVDKQGFIAEIWYAIPPGQ